jgi:hypothetical protein
VIGLRQAMQRVAQFGIQFERPRVFRNRFGKFALPEEINSIVIMVLGGLFRRVAHSAILTLGREQRQTRLHADFEWAQC